jgi:thymidylate synthase ThyX
MDIIELNKKLQELKQPFLKNIPVLGNSHVRLVDFMGSDARIVQAARVSYGEGTKTVREDKGLIDYLWRNQHTSPFEQVEFVFHTKLPIFVARQLVRTRTACLSGDTMVWFQQESANPLMISVKEIYDNWRVKHSTNHFELNAKMCEESTGKISSTHIKDIWSNGFKSVFEVRLKNGYSIKMTKDHLCLTDAGWNTLEHIADLKMHEDHEYSWNHKAPAFCCDESNTKTLSEIESITFVGTEEVFDIEVEGPFHNFVANGFIVHNSLNEISGRYSVMQDEFYVPPTERMQKQSEDNKQGSSDELIDYAINYPMFMSIEQQKSYEKYQEYLAAGMSRELARINLPLSLLTEWYWKIDLLNLFKFLNLRLDSHAQYEIREVAQAKYDLIKPIVPFACESFERHTLNGKKFSQDEMQILKTYIDPEKLQNDLTEAKWKSSKIQEFLNKL